MNSPLHSAEFGLHFITKLRMWVEEQQQAQTASSREEQTQTALKNLSLVNFFTSSLFSFF